MVDKTYTILDVINAECTLEPMRCLFCGSLEVTYDQGIHDALCSDCGLWQLEALDDGENPHDPRGFMEMAEYYENQRPQEKEG